MDIDKESSNGFILHLTYKLNAHLYQYMQLDSDKEKDES